MGVVLIRYGRSSLLSACDRFEARRAKTRFCSSSIVYGAMGIVMLAAPAASIGRFAKLRETLKIQYSSAFCSSSHPRVGRG